MVIILSASGVSSDLSSVFGKIPSGMVPINGKPAIAWTIDALLEQGFDEFIITVGYQKDLLKDFLNTFYAHKKCRIGYREVNYKQPPGNALIEISKEINSGTVLVVLGDTIVREKLRLIENIVYTSSQFDDPSEWCLVKRDQDGYFTNAFDKKNINEDGLTALIGIYFFKNVPLLKHVCRLFPSEKNYEISSILDRYSYFEKIKCEESHPWFDIGHLPKYHIAKTSLLNIREFNTMKYDNLRGTLVKQSKNKQKLYDEMQWYLKIPQELSFLVPRVISYDKDLSLELEYYGYPTLTELALYGNYHNNIWKGIITKLFDVLLLFKKYPGKVSLEEYKMMYLIKTNNRIHTLYLQDQKFKKFFSEKVVVNGKTLCSFNELENFIHVMINRLYQNSEGQNCFLHGDFCFSNILYDLRSGIIRLIDPRGRWGKGLYGDIRYDIAKLRHSAVGMYDHIINNIFTLDQDDNHFTLYIPSTKEQKFISHLIDIHIQEKWNLNEIQFIESLLFLSMIPLHPENKKKQLAMFCIGIQKLNEVYENIGTQSSKEGR
ncbi:MAG: hypothetical protein FJZ43_03965 [Candidatus Staskawiczbacteria bacterium]|nr:hypothetical protein [Candidatus Staskawiczbacteria bacterium]